MFDYIYLRIYQYFKEKGDNVPETKGVLILSLMQCFTLVDLMFAVQMVHYYQFPNKLTFLPLLLGVAAINWNRYERSFNLKGLEEKWKDEDQEKRVRNGWVIGIYLLVSLLTPVVYGYLKHNVKVI